MDRKKLILVPASTGLLALALFGTTAAYADSTPPQQGNAIETQGGLQSQGGPVDATETTAEKAETASETAPEKVEAGEPALPGGGHSDTDGQNVDNQFEGIQ